MKHRLLAKASLLSLALASAPQAASAQNAIDAFRDEVLVTATKKAAAENVQDVPLAVTAYGAEQLDALKVRDLGNLSYSMPNVGLEDIGTTRGVANFSIRGLGVNSSIPSIDPAVGTFIDGVYLGQNGGVVLDIFDLESVEVLRGPQGILFGRNVTGGAVLINTKKPNLSEAEGSFKGAVESGLRGTGNNYYAMGSVSAPLIEDTLAFKLSAYYNNDRGWYKRYLGGPNLVARVNQLGGTLAFLQANGFPIATNAPDAFGNFGKAETWMVRPQLLWEPSDTVSLLLRYEHFDSSGDGPAAQNHSGFAQPPFNALTNTTPAPVPTTSFFFSAPKDSFIFAIDEPGHYTAKADSITATLNVDVGPGTLTNIFGWRDTTGDSVGDIDGTPFWGFHSFARNDFRQLSNELRYAVSVDAFDVTIGGYYYDADHVYQENRFILGGFRTFFGGGVQQSRNWGLFGQVDLHLTDEFTLVAGGRYTDEKKDAVLYNLTFNSAACSVAAGTCLSVPTSSPLYGLAFLDDSRSWKNFTPKFGFQWDARDWFNIYGHYTQGVRSGGYNFRNTSTAFPLAPFDEETVNAFEVGFKAQPADGKATINAAVFVNNVKDMQREINLADPLAGVVQSIRNTADARIFGIEIETQIFLTDNLIFQGNLGRLDGEYKEGSVKFDLNSDGVVNATDESLDIPRLAPWTYGAGFIHSIPLAGHEMTTRFQYSHRDDNAYTDNNLGILNGADILDASIALNFGQATLSIYGQNLLNEVTHGGETQLPSSIGGGTFAPLNKGRVVGVEVQLGF